MEHVETIAQQSLGCLKEDRYGEPEFPFGWRMYGASKVEMVIAMQENSLLFSAV